MAGDRDDGIFRVDDLITAISANTVCYVVQVRERYL